MFFSFYSDQLDINTLTEINLPAILNLADITSLFYITKESLKTDDEQKKLSELVAL